MIGETILIVIHVTFFYVLWSNVMIFSMKNFFNHLLYNKCIIESFSTNYLTI